MNNFVGGVLADSTFCICLSLFQGQTLGGSEGNTQGDIEVRGKQKET